MSILGSWFTWGFTVAFWNYSLDLIYCKIEKKNAGSQRDTEYPHPEKLGPKNSPGSVPAVLEGKNKLKMDCHYPWMRWSSPNRTTWCVFQSFFCSVSTRCSWPTKTTLKPSLKPLWKQRQIKTNLTSICFPIWWPQLQNCWFRMRNTLFSNC